ncbi:hypothetical protein AVEN_252696-1 [Araneus ventricosus]|uniref:Uncharacterized protein n=1 Tax=Araneus ventricosus TaxID=182803 RepID=A0A4Y2V5V7_ARAVE|nr:hypothetical protein AVEN_252696-1 [Araneus ventricosus]
MLQLYAVPQFPEGVIFQHDGAPPHYGNTVQRYHALVDYAYCYSKITATPDGNFSLQQTCTANLQACSKDARQECKCETSLQQVNEASKSPRYELAASLPHQTHCKHSKNRQACFANSQQQPTLEIDTSDPDPPEKQMTLSGLTEGLVSPGKGLRILKTIDCNEERFVVTRQPILETIDCNEERFVSYKPTNFGDYRL